MNESQRILAKSVPEEDLSDWVVDMARTLRWKVARWPKWRPTNTDPGVPDLLLARDGMLLAVELKTDTGRLSEHQQAWIEAAGVYATVWRVSDWFSGEIQRFLESGDLHVHCHGEYHRCDGGGPGNAANYR